MKLEIGYNYDIEIRNEIYPYSIGRELRIMYLSDFHFNYFSKKITYGIIHLVEKMNPDILLLGGDYVDSKYGLVYLNDFLYNISRRNNIFAVAGNHDYFFGIKEIIRTMHRYNVNWIERASVKVLFNDIILQIDGNTIVPDESGNNFRILCLHKPLSPKQFIHIKYNLVFAGHLHGCQFVFWENRNRLFPGKFFYQNNFLVKKTGDCLYFISKGLGDTLPIRLNCTHDLLVVDVTNT